MKSEAARRANRNYKRRNPEKTRASKRAWKKRNYALNSEAWKSRAKTYRLENREKYKQAAREKHLRSTYGLTVGVVEGMLKKQRGNCAICKLELKKPCVDHCHTSGKIRGLLCQKCNLGLGLFSDSAVKLYSAIRYLKLSTKTE